jgi:hypothetical protein
MMQMMTKWAVSILYVRINGDLHQTKSAWYRFDRRMSGPQSQYGDDGKSALSGIELGLPKATEA